MDRRGFLGLVGSAGALGLVGRDAKAMPGGGADLPAVLVDTTKCVGCRTCETECARANGLPEPPDPVPEPARLSPVRWTVVNDHKGPKGEEVTAKRQCMHCRQPACVSACLTRAMHKTARGAVVWDGDKCMGCRYCMLSCPFDVPTFEYDSPNPRILKCRMCLERQEAGGIPACVENCPAEALTFGKRGELVRTAWRRIDAEPDKYVAHVYGEHEAGGTSYLYLSAIPFENLGMRTDLGKIAYGEYTKEFLYSVPAVISVVPAMLLGFSRLTKHEDAAANDAADGE